VRDGDPKFLEELSWGGAFHEVWWLFTKGGTT